jgi:5'-3' exonuclease
MRVKQKTQPQSVVKLHSLLIDGECLLKQGFHGTKQLQTEQGSSGTIYHFINTIRRFYEQYFITKVVVFWEGENSRRYRQTYYPYYKSQRNDRYTTTELDDLGDKRLRIKQYLEELFIRQVEVEGCEADDAIAHYVVNSPQEFKIIYTADRDLLQLIDPLVRVYLSDKKVMITDLNFEQHFPYHRGNVGLIKMMCGDVSDNISGLQGIGESVAFKWFPELKTEPKSVEWILERTQELLTENKKSVQLQTIADGKTKWGTLGHEYFAVMDKVINLKHPYVTEELIETINETVNDTLDPEGRGGVQLAMAMMLDDKILNLIPKTDDKYLDFWQPFHNIIQSEKHKFLKQSKS